MKYLKAKIINKMYKHPPTTTPTTKPMIFFFDLLELDTLELDFDEYSKVPASW